MKIQTRNFVGNSDKILNITRYHIRNMAYDILGINPESVSCDAIKNNIGNSRLSVGKQYANELVAYGMVAAVFDSSNAGNIEYSITNMGINMLLSLCTINNMSDIPQSGMYAAKDFTSVLLSDAMTYDGYYYRNEFDNGFVFTDRNSGNKVILSAATAETA